MNLQRFIIALLGVLFLSACTVGPDYVAPSINEVGEWFGFTENQKNIVNDTPFDGRWWNQFNDPLLSSYITRASVENKTLGIARTNITRARAIRRAANAGLFPNLGLGASANRESPSENSQSLSSSDQSLYDAGFDASWEIDVFGGTRRAVEAADARLESTIANKDDVLLTVLSDVGRSYYEARGLQKRIANTRDNLDLAERTLKLIQARLEVGEVSRFDEVRAQALVQEIAARLPALEAEWFASVFQLSVLVGQPPEALIHELQAIQPLPTPPDFVPVGLRSDILRRRPDVREAERMLAAETADIGVAVAELFPKFDITGSVGNQARVFGDLFETASNTWGLAGGIDLALFRGGALRAQIEAEEAEAEGALLNYDQTVLEALRDAQTALVRYGQELKTRKRLAQAAESQRESTDLSLLLLEEGEADIFSVLEAQQDLLAAENDLIISETQSVVNLIALYTALGGGWEEIEG